MANVVITGANRGIGLALCKEYLLKKDTVYAICRAATEELKKLDLTIIENIDVTKDSELLREKLRDIDIDILINNAGIMRVESSDNFNFETMIEQFEVNTLSPLKVTASLLNNLKAGSKIAMITSRMGSIADNDSGGYYGYRMSKAALNAGSTSLARDLAPKKIAIGIIHPGYVKTDMTAHSGMIEASESAQGIVQRINDLNDSNSGTFWHSNGEVLPW